MRKREVLRPAHLQNTPAGWRGRRPRSAQGRDGVHYKQYQDEQSPADRTAYATVECAAMKAKIGLWSQPNPVQPQDFRHGTHSALLFGPDGCRISSEPTSGPVVGSARSHIFEWPSCP